MADLVGQVPKTNFFSAKMPSEDPLGVLSNWQVPDGKRLEDSMTVTRSVGHSSETKGGNVDFVTPESCILLTRGCDEDTTLCSLTLKSHDSAFITRVCIASEARNVEVYGMNGEYLFTVKSEFFDDFEGMTVYHTEVTFQQAVNECTLKFAGLKHRMQMWLYGFAVCLKPPSERPGSISHLMNGQQLKSFLSMCEAALPGAQKVATLMSACERRLSGLDLREDRNKPGSKQQDAAGSGSSYGSLAEELKVFVTSKMEEMEQRILRRVNQRLDEMERRHDEKLNLILSLLQSQNGNR